MIKIRRIEIRNFRSILSLDWCPTKGINCLIGPGDSGKSSILDAIDACLTARRSLPFSDTDFYNLDVSHAINIKVTLGNLPDHMKDLDTYGEYLRGFFALLDTVVDEPQKDAETVLTIQLTVEADLEPVWRLYSDRSANMETPRSLPWRERMLLAPARLGSHSSSNLSWTRGSVLNRLSEERIEVGAELVKAARDARTGFGEKAGVQLKTTLDTVTKTALKLGVPIGTAAKALLDAHAVSFGDGAISLHSESGIPLRNLGTGSARLLLAGLHREAASAASIILVDEVEFGLEPHRLTRLLHSMGSKEMDSPLQVFMTTHSPVAVRELSGRQLQVLRIKETKHIARLAGDSNEVQSTLRCDPEAFLARTVIVCEGASEIGLIRGFDLYFSQYSNISLQAAGVAFVNANGGSPDKCLYRAMAMRQLDYRVIAFIDNDKPATASEVKRFEMMGGFLVTWREEQALEDVLFRAFSADTTDQLITYAIESSSLEFVDENLKKCAVSPLTIQQIWDERNLTGDYSPEHRKLLGAAARLRNRGWFKSITKMEDLARNILAPKWDQSTLEFQEVIQGLYKLATSPDD